MSAPHFHRHHITRATMPGVRTKTGTLSADFTREDITRTLGFDAEVSCPYTPGLITVLWEFTVDGRPCVIWSYRGRRWSVYDPCGIVPVLFGMKAKGGRDATS